jgi:methylated-DNA-[protein]-cysteine S-methyltransferase
VKEEWTMIAAAEAVGRRVDERGRGDGQRLNEGTFDSPIGRLVLVWSAAGVRALVFERRRRGSPEGPARHAARTPRRAPLPAALRSALEDYFRGRPAALERIPLDVGGTPFQRRAWQAMRRIPPGRVVSYGALAKALGTPNGARAVGRAAATNPVTLIVPCHRVVGGRGALTGFLWGVERKRWLLAHEGAHVEGATHAGMSKRKVFRPA